MHTIAFEAAPSGQTQKYGFQGKINNKIINQRLTTIG